MNESNNTFFQKLTIAEADNRRSLPVVCLFLLFLTLSEYLSTMLATVQIGLIGHGLTLLALLLFSALTKDIKDQRLYMTLAFAPLIRLISLSLPLQGLPMVYWYLLVGLLTYIAIYYVIRYGQFTWEQAGVTARFWFLQLIIGLVGVGLGYVEYFILKPEPLIEEMTLAQIWFPALILIIFTGILEELVFRGLMQTAFIAKFKSWLGIGLISFLFAVLHLGYKSLLDFFFVFVVAVLFGIVTKLTGSILGVSIAHGLTNVTLFLIFPFIIGHGK